MCSHVDVHMCMSSHVDVYTHVHLYSSSMHIYTGVAHFKRFSYAFNVYS